MTADFVLVSSTMPPSYVTSLDWQLKDVYGVATSYQAKVLARQAGIKTVRLLV